MVSLTHVIQYFRVREIASLRAVYKNLGYYSSRMFTRSEINNKGSIGDCEFDILKINCVTVSDPDH